MVEGGWDWDWRGRTRAEDERRRRGKGRRGEVCMMGGGFDVELDKEEGWSMGRGNENDTSKKEFEKRMMM